MDIPYVEQMPIPELPRGTEKTVSDTVAMLIELTQSITSTRHTLHDWLAVEHEIRKPSQKLLSLVSLDSDAFVAEVKRIRGKKNPFSVAALKSLRDEHARTIEPARAQAAEALQLERQLSDLVNAAYGLTPEEITLMWQTTPPRMPFSAT